MMAAGNWFGVVAISIPMAIVDVIRIGRVRSFEAIGQIC